MRTFVRYSHDEAGKKPMRTRVGKPVARLSADRDCMIHMHTTNDPNQVTKELGRGWTESEQ